MPEDKNSRLIAQILSGRASSYDKITVAAAFILALIIHVLLIETLPKNFEPRNLELDDEVDELELDLVAPEIEKLLPEYIEANPEANNQKPEKDTNLESFQDQRAAQENPDPNSEADKPRTDGEHESQKIVSADASEQPIASNPQEVFEILERPLENANPQNSSGLASAPALQVPIPTNKAAQDSKQSASPISVVGNGEDEVIVSENQKPEIQEGENKEQETPSLEELVPQNLPSPRARPRISMRTPAGPIRNSNTDANAVGTLAVNSRFSEFGAYQQRMIEAISRQWYLLGSKYDLASAIGSKVQVEFKLNPKGEITRIKTLFSTSTQVGTNLCEMAITTTAPYGEWTEEMLVTFGSQDQNVSIMFYYY